MSRRVNKRDLSVTPGQLALIHVAKKDLGLDDDDYRSILTLYGGADSAKYLTLEGFERVMLHLERLGFQSSNIASRQPKYRPYQDGEGIPYPAQLKMIEHHFEQLGMLEQERRQGFCQRTIKRPWPQTRNEANKIFEALKAMLARQEKKSYTEGGGKRSE